VFEKVRAQQPKRGSVKECVLFSLEDSPILMVKQATQANEAYFNAALKMNRARVRELQSGNVNVEMIKTTRDRDRILYAKYVVEGWKRVKTDDGKDAPFTKENVLEYLKALPDHIFDNEVRVFCTNHQNFMDEDAPVLEGDDEPGNL